MQTSNLQPLYVSKLQKVRVIHLLAKNANSWQECSDLDNHSSISTAAFNVY